MRTTKNEVEASTALSLAALEVIQTYGTAGWPLEIDFGDLVTSQAQLPGLRQSTFIQI